MRFVKRNKRSKELPLEGELVTSSSESLKLSSKLPEDPTRQSGVEAETNTSESKQTWPGLLESADKVRIPIKARDKVGYSSEEIQSFPDMFLDELNIEEGKAILASIRGDLKRHQGFLRQDSAIIETVSLGLSAKYVLLIVADGVGSKRDSHLASRAAVIAASNEFRALDFLNVDTWELTAKKIFQAAVLGIEVVAFEKSLRSEDLLTTLTVVALELTQTSERTLFQASVGNCRVLKIEENSLQEVNAEVNLDLLANTKTRALPLNISEISATVEKIGCDAILCLLSDGAFEVWGQGLDFVSLLKSDDLESHKLAWALDVRSAGRVDDRTLAMWRPW